MALSPRLDVITIGRSSVDLYGAQVGGRLEDMASFSKAVGGCPTNIAIGTARLGLKSGLVTRVGDEHMGRFIREQCAREGVDVEGIRSDPVLASHGAGEERYINSGEVTKSLSDILPQCDLIVGTEDEMMIAGGADNPLAALRAVRAASQATLVLKRGPMGQAPARSSSSSAARSAPSS